MSKLRQNLLETDAPLETPSVPDGLDFVAFTKKRDDLPYKYAGFINAPDATLGLAYAREHYGQDEECISIWLVPTEYIGGRDASFKPGKANTISRTFEIFNRDNEGGVHVHTGFVSASDPNRAIAQAKESIAGAADAHSIWAVDRLKIHATRPDDLIWRHVSQDYRLARGYSKDVRQKWEAIRAAEEVDRYQEEDLKETF